MSRTWYHWSSASGTYDTPVSLKGGFALKVYAPMKYVMRPGSLCRMGERVWKRDRYSPLRFSSTALLPPRSSPYSQVWYSCGQLC